MLLVALVTGSSSASEAVATGDSNFLVYEAVGGPEPDDTEPIGILFPGSDGNGLPWFSDGTVPANCTLSGSPDGIAVYFGKTDPLPCGTASDSDNDNNSADRVVIEGLILIPPGATSMSLEGSNYSVVEGSHKAGAVHFYTAASDDFADLAYRGGAGVVTGSPVLATVHLPLPSATSACAAPPAIAYRIDVFDGHAGMAATVRWDVTGGAHETTGFETIPAAFLSSPAGYDNDGDDNGLPDYLEADADSDGVLDFEEMQYSLSGTTIDTDGDGSPDCDDTDSDNDGLADGIDPNRLTPNAADDSTSVLRGATVTFDVESNDSEFPGTNDSITIQSGGTATGATVKASGQVVWDSTGYANGHYTVIYEICNEDEAPHQGCATATLTITVTGNDAADDGPITMNPAGAQTIDVSTNDPSLLAGADFTLTGAGTAVGTAEVDIDSGVLTYTPHSSEVGSTVTLEYSICPDGVTAGSPGCDTATVTINVGLEAVDDGPIDLAPPGPQTIDVASNDPHISSGADFALTGGGTAQGNAEIDVDTGLLTYTPDPSEADTSVTVEYSVCPDGLAPPNSMCTTATLTLNIGVDAVEDGPVDMDLTGSHTFDVTSNDPFVPEGATFSLTGSGTALGTASIDPDTGVVTYVPVAADVGDTVSLEYEVCPDGVDPGSDSCDTALLLIDVHPADITVTATNQGPVVPGETAVVQIDVEHLGTGDTDADTTVVYTPPTGTEVDMSALPEGCAATDPADGSVTCTASVLTTGDTAQFLIPVDVPVDADPNTDFDDGSVTATNPDDTDPSDNVAASTVSTGPQVADLSVAVSNPGEGEGVIPGEETSITVTVTNAGPSLAESTTFIYNPPPGVTVDTANLPSGCSMLPGDVSVECAVDSINPDGEAIIDIPVLVASEAPETTILSGGTVQATCAGTDPDGASVATELTTGEGLADLEVTVEGVPTITQGSSGVIDLNLHNHGPSDAASVDVTYPLPDGVVFDSSHPNPNGCTEAAGVITCPIGGPIPAGQNIEVAIPITVQTSGPLDPATTTLTNAGTNDPTPGNNSAVATPTIQLATVTGSVFLDSDRDGAFGADETDISGVVVNLTAPGPDGELGTADDVIVQTTTTQSPYIFEGVADGEYRITVDPDSVPTGRFATDDADSGSDNHIDIVVTGDDITGRDFGEYFAALSGVVVDPDGNPLPNTEVEITDAAGNTFRVTTGTDGSFSVEGDADNPLMLGEATVTADVNGVPVTQTIAVLGASEVMLTRLVTPAAPATPQSLAFTGASSELLMLVGAALMVTGVGLSVVRRRPLTHRR